MKKVKAVSHIEALIEKRYGESVKNKVMAIFAPAFEAICNENKNDPKAVKAHTEQKIFPAICFYKAMQQAGIEKDAAFSVIYDSFEADAEKETASMKAMLKIPFSYKLMPFMWKIVTKKQFGEDAGFRFSFYPTGRDRVKFDMLKCPYCDVCRKYGCPEITTVFCHTDDVHNENLHPKLLWNRSKIMGDGGDCCDFDLIVKD